ncbi:MAG: hypothetical protein EA383_06315 [Spirochaetaceae bacterium]|nr:MAG: hypothetical protein EA383_06315 [Spirochaetaceae bacterium]
MVLGLLLLAPAVFGQDFGNTMTESRLFNVEMGFLAGYDFGAEETVTGSSTALNLAILENAEIGFVRVSFSSDDGVAVADTYNLLRFNYFFTQQLSLSLASGAESGSAAGSLGGNFLLVRSIPEDGFSSTMKINVQYLFNEAAGIGDGTLGISLLGTIGL